MEIKGDFTFMVKPFQFHSSNIIADANLKSCKISKMERFAESFNSYVKRSILNTPPNRIYYKPYIPYHFSCLSEWFTGNGNDITQLLRTFVSCAPYVPSCLTCLRLLQAFVFCVPYLTYMSYLPSVSYVLLCLTFITVACVLYVYYAPYVSL